VRLLRLHVPMTLGVEPSVATSAYSSRISFAAARYFGRGKSLSAFSEKGATATADRPGVTGIPGITVDRVVSTGRTFI
jgi:hypothetical protein